MPLPRPIAASLAALLCTALVGCGSDATLSGRVKNDVLTVSAPAMSVPAPDVNAGFAPSPNSGGTRSRPTTAQSISAVGQMARVASVAVEPGSMVSTGTIIATFEGEALDAGIGASVAAARAAQAQIGVIDAALDEIASGRGDVASARAQATSAITELTATREQLVAQRATLQGILDRLPSGPPPSLPPSMPPPGPLPDPAELRAAIAKIDAGLAKIDAGLAQARSGLGTLSSATAKLADAEAQLDDARELAVIAADAASVPVSLSRYLRELAVVRSPVSGVVVSAVRVGDVLAPGATVATVRPGGRARVTTWIAPDALESVTAGTTRAVISADWAASPLEGTVVRVSPRAVWPPTSLATREVHLTRAFEIEIEIDADVALPAGAPVDVVVQSR